MCPAAAGISSLPFSLQIGEEISQLVSGDPGLGAVLGAAVCFCFPRRLLGVPDTRLSAGSVVSRAGPGSAVLAGNVLRATHGWMEQRGEAGNSHVHPLWKAAPVPCVIVIPSHMEKVRPSHEREAGTEISARPRSAWNPNECQQGGHAINKTSPVTNSRDQQQAPQRGRMREPSPKSHPQLWS